MTSGPDLDRPAPPRRVWLLAIPVIVLGGWVMLRMYTSFGSDQCAEGYAAARTAADTARVDSLVPKDEHGVKERTSCGFRRTSARWSADVGQETRNPGRGHDTQKGGW